MAKQVLHAAGLFVVAAIIAVLIAGLRAPISYDEGYNLQVPRHLVSTGDYATDGSVYGENSGSRLFDARISTGPTVLLPVAAAMAVTEETLLPARLVTSLFAVVAFIAAALVGWRIAGGWGSVLAPASVLTVNTTSDWPHSVVYGTGDVLGEYSAAALILTAALLLPRMRWAGALLSLAILAKLLSLIALPAFVLAILINRDRSISKRTRDLFGLMAGVAIPLAAWSVIRFAVMGPTLFEIRGLELLRFTVEGGSGLSSGPSPSIAQRTVMFADSFYGPMLLLVSTLVATAGIVISRSIDTGAVSGNLPTGRSSTHDYLTPALVLAGTLLVSWWFFVADKTYGRHLLLGLFLLLPVASGWLVHGLVASGGSHKRTRLPLVAAAIAVAVSSTASLGMHVQGAWSPPGPTLAQQQAAADSLRAREAVGFSFVGGWWQAPEIAFLAQLRADPAPSPGGLFVVTPIQRLLDPSSVDAARSTCEKSLYRADGYEICRSSSASDSS